MAWPWLTDSMSNFFGDKKKKDKKACERLGWEKEHVPGWCGWCDVLGCDIFFFSSSLVVSFLLVSGGKGEWLGEVKGTRGEGEVKASWHMAGRGWFMLRQMK